MSETARLVADTADRLFAAHAEAAREEAARGVWPAALWDAFEGAGLVDALGAGQDEEGAGLAAGFAMLRAAGRHAAPIPAAETLVARRLLASAEIAAPPGPLALAVVADGPVPETLHRVAWARDARALALVSQSSGGNGRIALVEIRRDHVSPGLNLAGEPRDDVALARADIEFRTLPDDADEVARLAAAARAAALRGAMDQVLAMSVRYAGERKQFGRPIGRFQAIQHHLAAMAGHVAASGAAVDAAAESGSALALAAAAAETSAAAGEVAAIAHQVHGAMGFTREHALHHWTKRLWAWREERGNEAYWWAEIGRETVLRGAEALWPMFVES